MRNEHARARAYGAERCYAFVTKKFWFISYPDKLSTQISALISYQDKFIFYIILYTINYKLIWALIWVRYIDTNGVPSARDIIYRGTGIPYIARIPYIIARTAIIMQRLQPQITFQFAFCFGPAAG